MIIDSVTAHFYREEQRQDWDSHLAPFLPHISPSTLDISSPLEVIWEWSHRGSAYLIKNAWWQSVAQSKCCSNNVHWLVHAYFSIPCQRLITAHWWCRAGIPELTMGSNAHLHKITLFSAQWLSESPYFSISHCFPTMCHKLCGMKW